MGVGHCKDLGFCSKGNEDSLQVLFSFLDIYLFTLEREKENKWRQEQRERKTGRLPAEWGPKDVGSIPEP